MNKLNLIMLGVLLSSNTVMAADSVHKWGSWQAGDVTAAILAGADPAEVTSAPSAGPGAKGTAAQAIIPVALDDRSITQEEMPREFVVFSIPPTIGPIDNLDPPGSGLGTQVLDGGSSTGAPDRFHEGT